ncbi:MAG TPA: hypothetical protein VGJ25_10010 [Gaiellaceae bacterium]
MSVRAPGVRVLPGVVLRPVVIPDPGAGVTPVITVPGSYEWRVVALNLLFGTSATVANRGVYLRLRSSTRELIRVPIVQRQKESLSVFYTWSTAAGAVEGGIADLGLLVPLPELPLVPGFTLDVLCDAFQGADQFTFITLLVYESETGGEPAAERLGSELVQPLTLAGGLEP